MSINANLSGSLTSANALPTDFSWVLWWMWLGTPGVAFANVFSVDNATTFYDILSPGSTTALQCNAPGNTLIAFMDPGANQWICLAGISLGASGSTSTFLARKPGDRRWSTTVTDTSTAVRAGNMILFNESALDQPSTAIMQGFKMWSGVKTLDQLLLESAQLAPIDNSSLWSYPQMNKLQGAGQDLRGKNAFTSAGTFVADGREPPVPVQLAPRSMYHQTLSMR